MLGRLWSLTWGAGGGGGGSAAAALVNNGTHSSSDTQPSTATSGVSFNTNGACYGTGNVVNSPAAYMWRTTGVSSDYEIWFEKTSGTNPSGVTLNSWLPLTSTRTAQLIQATVGTVSCVLLVKIRDVATATELDTGTITLSSELIYNSGGSGDGGGGYDGGPENDGPGGGGGREQN